MDVYMFVGREGSDEVHFILVEDKDVFDEIIGDCDDDGVMNRLYSEDVQDNKVVKSGFLQTRCQENILEGYNIKDMYCFCIF